MFDSPQLLRPFRRHGRKGLVFFGVVIALTVGFLIVTPRLYRSAAKLLVRLGRENSTLDPTVTLGQNTAVAVPLSRENEINSVVDILQSRDIAEKVAQRLGPGPILYGEAEPSGPALQPLDSSIEERLIETLLKNFTIEAARRSNVIDVAYLGYSPAASQKIVQTLVDVYLEAHVRLNRTHGSHDFFVEQTEKLRIDLDGKEKALRDLKNTTGLAQADEQRRLLIKRTGEMEDDLSQTQTARASAEAKVKSLKAKLEALPALQVTQKVSGYGNEGTDKIREQFYALQVREKEASTKYSDDHPRMLQIREQLAEAKALLDSEDRTRTQVTQEPGRLHQQAQAELMQEETLLASLTAKSEKLQTQIASSRDELKKLTDDEMRIASLQRETDLADAEYRRYSASTEQARIDEALQTERMSNIAVAQPASYQIKAASPRTKIVLAFGFAFGLFGAIAFCLAFDRWESFAGKLRGEPSATPSSLWSVEASGAAVDSEPSFADLPRRPK